MSDARRLTSQGKERKQQLIDAAAELFAERGYEETRIVDIVERAGVAKGLFYWYFENKAALFRDLVEETYNLVEQHLPEVDVELLRTIFRSDRAPLEALPGRPATT